MYNKLIELIKNNNDLSVTKELTIIKNKIKRGESVRSSIYETYICMQEMISAPIDNKYKESLTKTINVIENELLPLMENDIEQEEKDKVIKDIMSDNNKLRKEQLKNAKISESIPSILLNENDNNEEDNNIDQVKPSCNKIAYALKICAILEGIIGYFVIIGILYYYITSRIYISFITVFLYILIIVLSICFTLGFSEIIQILHDIRKKLLK